MKNEKFRIIDRYKMLKGQGFSLHITQPSSAEKDGLAREVTELLKDKII